MSPRRRLFAAAVAVLVLLVAAGGLLARYGPTLGGAAVAQDELGPVLLVTGYGGGTAALDQLAADLRARGREAVTVPAVGDGTGDLRDQAAALGEAVDRVLADGAPSVDVVGYSAGGVVVRLWAQDNDGAEVARRIVTLGSPHHGAEVAALGLAVAPSACPEACRQLVPGSDLLTGLDETPDGPIWTALWSDDDEVVTPPESGQLAGALNVELQAVCPTVRVGHGELPTSPLSVALIDLALGAEPLDSVPDSSRCAELTAAGA